ncbi:MAG: 3-oxoacyl-[acyl-carrier protein] reductase [Bacteroidota bacterium]|nr:3-oxoacyl-[acyl-carrier protein] reductase [Bacteroidota bacterium]
MILKGKTAIVTGASRGIGAATAKLLAFHGASVVVNYNKSADAAHKVVEEIIAHNGKAIAAKANVFDHIESEMLVMEAIEKYGAIDILVLNAAAKFKILPFMEQTWEDFSQKLNDEIKGSYYTIKTALPYMIERKKGNIIMVSSGLSRRAGQGFSAHTTAKSALDGFAKALAFEMGPHGIRVNVVAPGLTMTDATAFMSKERIEASAAQTPLRRVGKPEDIAGAIALLASDEAGFITGNYIAVSGGMIML